MDSAQSEVLRPKSGRPFRIAAVALLVAAGALFFGSFVAASKTPLVPSPRHEYARGQVPFSCGHHGPACVGFNPEQRQRVFFGWIGLSLLALGSGAAVRSIANRRDRTSASGSDETVNGALGTS